VIGKIIGELKAGTGKIGKYRLEIGKNRSSISGQHDFYGTK
jgi:hypothetical protein